MAVIAETDTFFAPHRDAWREWLAAHHGSAPFVWLLIHKKHVAEPSVSYDEAVEEALCWGWIDGLDEPLGRAQLRGTLHAAEARQRLEREQHRARREDDRRGPDDPRRAGARRRGAAPRPWDEAASGRLEVTPADLEEALAAEPAAAARWRALAASHRRMYIPWILAAKRPPTRARRVAEVVRRLAEGLSPGATAERLSRLATPSFRPAGTMSLTVAEGPPPAHKEGQ